MLCPVCNETPLRGRQKICSTKCRSASYRQRKRLHQSTPQAGVPLVSNRRPRSSRREDVGRWEQFLATATDRIVEAILKHGNRSLFQRPSECRVELRTQVISQAPKQAIGYRLVLPGHCASDSPKLSPKRSQARASAWYSLTPFEYPDDLRLRDGSCYRLIWIDAAGLRIRLKPEESIPSVYFFLIPPTVANSTTENEPPEVVSQERDKHRVTSTTSMTEEHSVRSSQNQSGAALVVISASETEADPTPIAPMSRLAATEESPHSPAEQVVPHPEPKIGRSEVSQQSVTAGHQPLSAYTPLSNELNPTLMVLAGSEVTEPPYYVPSAASEHSTDSGGEDLPLYVCIPESVPETIVADTHAETNDRAESVPVQSAPNPRSLLAEMDDLAETDDLDGFGANLQSLIERLDQGNSRLPGVDATIEDWNAFAKMDWIPSEEWIADFKSKSILDALRSIEGVWALSPTLHEESDSASDSGKQFRSQFHGEVSALAREAESKLGDGNASFLIAERTESFIKNQVLKALDRWDLQLGFTNEESLSIECLSGIAKQSLARVHQALLLWLDGIGVTSFYPEAEPFNEMLHHRHSQVHQRTIRAGYIVEVLRTGYLRDGKLLRRAHVIVAR